MRSKKPWIEKSLVIFHSKCFYIVVKDKSLFCTPFAFQLRSCEVLILFIYTMYTRIYAIFALQAPLALHLRSTYAPFCVKLCPPTALEFITCNIPGFHLNREKKIKPFLRSLFSQFTLLQIRNPSSYTRLLSLGLDAYDSEHDKLFRRKFFGL